ncbi:MAG: DUF2917 domain-containing protein [Sumerlaeia bacterium]
MLFKITPTVHDKNFNSLKELPRGNVMGCELRKLCRIELVSGVLWITESGVNLDSILKAGETWQPQNQNSCVVLQGLAVQNQFRIEEH